MNPLDTIPLQAYWIPPDAVSVVHSFLHISTSPVIFGLGKGLTVTTTTLLPEHPLVSVTVTEYEVVIVGLTDIVAVFKPVFHLYVIPPLATKVVDSPKHITVFPAINGFGKGCTVTDLFVLATHPFTSVTVTLYTVDTLGFTEILTLVLPVLQM